MTTQQLARRRIVGRLMAEARARERLTAALDGIVRDVVNTADVKHDCLDRNALDRLIETTLHQSADDGLAALETGLDDVFSTCSVPEMDRIAIGRRRREMGLD